MTRAWWFGFVWVLAMVAEAVPASALVKPLRCWWGQPLTRVRQRRPPASDHWTWKSESYCYVGWLAILDQVSLKPVEPATVATAWGRGK